MRRGRAAIAVAILGVVLATGCGERKFEAADLVAELNEAGAGLVLGDALPQTEGAARVFSLTFDSTAVPASGDVHGAGAIVVLEDSEQAEDEFARCDAAIDFTCFRAGNAVLRFTGITAAEQGRITGAVQALAD